MSWSLRQTGGGSDEQIARREAANALRQAQRVTQIILEALGVGTFRLRPSTILDLNACAIEGLSIYAGNWRPGAVSIGSSEHQPPDGRAVPGLVEDLCDYVNDNWATRSAIHLAAFVMWRLNWIHPFSDGNGRTSRAVSYVVLCIRSDALLPGQQTIPEQIKSNRIPYYDALEAADRRHSSSTTFPEDIVVEMEELLAGMLAVQLKSAFDGAMRQHTDDDETEKLINELGTRAKNSRSLLDDASAHVRVNMAEIAKRHKKK